MRARGPIDVDVGLGGHRAEHPGDERAVAAIVARSWPGGLLVGPDAVSQACCFATFWRKPVSMTATRDLAASALRLMASRVGALLVGSGSVAGHADADGQMCRTRCCRVDAAGVQVGNDGVVSALTGRTIVATPRCDLSDRVGHLWRRRPRSRGGRRADARDVTIAHEDSPAPVLVVDLVGPVHVLLDDEVPVDVSSRAWRPSVIRLSCAQGCLTSRIGNVCHHGGRSAGCPDASICREGHTRSSVLP